MKKLLALLLALLMLAGAVSCTTQTTTDQQKESESPSASALPESNTIAQSSPLPSLSPTPAPATPSTPEPSSPTELTPEQLLAKKRNNTASSTQEDLNVIPVGLYEFVLADGRKLAYEGMDVKLVGADVTENTQFLVSFQNAGTDSTGRAGVRYVIYAGDSVEKSLYCPGATVCLKESNDRLSNYNWRFIENEDGTVQFKFLSGSTVKLLEVTESGALACSNQGVAKGETNFKMNLISEDIKSYEQYISEKGDIVLRVSSMVKLKDARFQKLANDMQVAYETYYELTNFLPYESIIIRVYQNEPYFGYVYQGWNVISFNVKNAISDLGNILGRDKLDINDWNFCLLHEMGHMFDWGRGWRFHGEFATNMKVAYVLYANKDVGASAATSGYSYKKCFDGDTIVDMWNTCPKMTEATGFNLDRVLYVFVSYAQSVGWDNVKKAYQEIQAMETQERNAVKCLELFTDTMAKHAPDNEHVKDRFQEGEWEMIVEEIS